MALVRLYCIEFPSLLLVLILYTRKMLVFLCVTICLWPVKQAKSPYMLSTNAHHYLLSEYLEK